MDLTDICCHSGLPRATRDKLYLRDFTSEPERESTVFLLDTVYSFGLSIILL